jgi:hypothetical protein
LRVLLCGDFARSALAGRVFTLGMSNLNGYM